MSPIPEPDLSSTSSTGGVYDVNESGLHFRHAPSLPTPKDGIEFLSRLSNHLSVNILERPSPDELVFELIGVDVSFANALRRIMIAEVPTVAFETIYMWNNTGLIHDEVLSHRLGLIPLNVDPRHFDEYGFDVDEDGNPAATDRNTIVFRLNATCGRNPKDDEKIRKKMESKWKAEGLVSGYDVMGESASKQSKEDINRTRMMEEGEGEEEENDEEDIDNLEPSVMNLSLADKAAAAAVATSSNNAAFTTPIDSPHRPFTRHVYARDLLWAPQGDQLARFPLTASSSSSSSKGDEGGGVLGGITGGGIRPLHEDILIAKLRPGQVIELEAHARKGVGKDHAKFSPVATASYRLLPHIEIVKPIYDELAEELVNWYEPGVFRTVPATENGHRVKAVVSNPYACTMSRNFMRNPILKESIKMSRVPNHFIFSVESVGMMAPAIIVAEALTILQKKCERVSALADDAEENNMG
jgi:DNA-directed RNA polymerase alpha subunit